MSTIDQRRVLSRSSARSAAQSAYRFSWRAWTQRFRDWFGSLTHSDVGLGGPVAVSPPETPSAAPEESPAYGSRLHPFLGLLARGLDLPEAEMEMIFRKAGFTVNDIEVRLPMGKTLRLISEEFGPSITGIYQEFELGVVRILIGSGLFGSEIYLYKESLFGKNWLMGPPSESFGLPGLASNDNRGREITESLRKLPKFKSDFIGRYLPPGSERSSGTNLQPDSLPRSS
jgi:hypothetical protein